MMNASELIIAKRYADAAGGIDKLLAAIDGLVMLRTQPGRALPARRPWTDVEREFVRLHYGHGIAAGEIARKLERSKTAVRQMATTLGVNIYRCVPKPKVLEAIERLHPHGYSDAEIASELGCDRHRVGQLRRGLGLPSDLRPRAVAILNALYDRGPMTRRELADVIGMPWKGSRKSLASNDPEGSYLAHLAARGLVRAVKRGNRVTGRGRGHSTNVYMIPLTIKRGDPNTWPRKDAA